MTIRTDPLTGQQFDDGVQDDIGVERDNIDNPNISAQPGSPGDRYLPGVTEGNKYKGTNKTADELVALYGYAPDGTPRTEAVPDTPSCPPVSLEDGPFDTTAIPPGCNQPLSPECAAYYNDQRAKQGYTE